MSTIRVSKEWVQYIHYFVVSYEVSGHINILMHQKKIKWAQFNEISGSIFSILILDIDIEVCVDTCMVCMHVCVRVCVFMCVCMCVYVTPYKALHVCM